MKTKVTVIIVVAVFCFAAGCSQPLSTKTSAGKELLNVDFQKEQILRYRFVSRKDIKVDWGELKRSGKTTQRKIDKSFEVLEMVVAYNPVKVDPYGLTVIQARCQSVKAERSAKKTSQKDAVESIAGKTFTFTVDAAGRIKDYSQLDKLVQQTGQKTFRQRGKAGRIKEPDMIADFIVSQWFLWDSISSIEEPIEGISIGQSWNSQLSVPTPMITRWARDVTYTLGQIRQTEKGRIAEIESTYSPAKTVPESWPKPYPAGKVRMKGRFGFLGNYRLIDLNGRGTEYFNIDAGRMEKYDQQYTLKVSASLLLPLGVNPVITIDQKITAELLEN